VCGLNNILEKRLFDKYMNKTIKFYIVHYYMLQYYRTIINLLL